MVGVLSLAALPLLVACGGSAQVDPLLLPPQLDLDEATQPMAGDAPGVATLSSFNQGGAVSPGAVRAPAGEVVEREDGLPVLVLQEVFLDAWRRLGLALDRAGFTVEDRDRSERRYLVRYDPTAMGDGETEGGLLSGLAFWNSSDPVSGPELYAVRLLSAGSVSRAWVTAADGTPIDPELGRQMLLLIRDSLR